MRSQVDVASAYTLTVTDAGSVTITDLSTNYSSTFTPSADGTSFTTVGIPGYFTAGVLAYRCGNGTEHRLFSWGQDIEGRLSGEEMSGKWVAFFEDLDDGSAVEFAAKFAGKR